MRVLPHSLKHGYKLIDTASVYKNEMGIGNALKKSSVPRKELFITSKLAPADHGYEETIRAFNESLKQLQTDYLDLYLIHWPGANFSHSETTSNLEKRKQSWLALEKLHKDGKIKAIGVSNYAEQHLNEMQKYATIIPAVNQFECHPCLLNEKLRKFCQQKGIVVEAYAPLGKARYFDHPVIEKLADKHMKTPAQILLRWGLQHDMVLIPKTGNKLRIEENTKFFDFSLSEEEMKELNGLDEDRHYCWNPYKVP